MRCASAIGASVSSKSNLPRVVIVSPALAAANNGNWHTAARWARLLRGHCRTDIVARWQGQPHELMIALHARRSAASIDAHARALPATPRVVVLTGTDLYRDIRSDADAQRSLRLATRLVVLQPLGLDELTAEQRARAAVIVQSATPLRPLVKTRSRLLATMVGHLRDEKDPLAYMRAARRLSRREDIRCEHIGDALEAPLGDAARATMRDVPNYVWRGGLSRAATRQRMRRAHVLVHASRMEGGAQAIIEAVQAGTPVIASRIPGNIGLLGDDWPAQFEVGDDVGLSRLIERTRDEPAFLAALQDHAHALSPRFDPGAEAASLLNLVRSTLETSRT
jgi:putative glycosyltransferase (TIGR04348 family)